MNQKAEQLNETMLQDMQFCQREGFAPSVELECLFSICNKYWVIVQNEVANHVFESEEEEVIFFKDIKPKFVSERLYYGLVSHAQLFKESTNDPATLKKFWLQEKQRLEKFKAAHYDLWEYYTTCQTDKDIEWFTHKNNDEATDL